VNKHVEVKAAVDTTPAIMITFTHQVDDNRSVCLQSAIASDCPVAELNSLMDKLSHASNRQRAVARIPTIRSLLEIREGQLKKETAELFSVEAQQGVLNDRLTKDHIASGRRGPFRPAPAQAQELQKLSAAHDKARGNLRSLQNEIEQLNIELRDLEQKAKGPED